MFKFLTNALNNAKEYAYSTLTNAKDYVVSKLKDAKDYVVSKLTGAKDYVVSKTLYMFTTAKNLRKAKQKEENASPAEKDADTRSLVKAESSTSKETSKAEPSTLQNMATAAGETIASAWETSISLVNYNPDKSYNVGGVIPSLVRLEGKDFVYDGAYLVKNGLVTAFNAAVTLAYAASAGLDASACGVKAAGSALTFLFDCLPVEGEYPEAEAQPKVDMNAYQEHIRAFEAAQADKDLERALERPKASA